MPTNTAKITAANRAAWNTSAPLHQQGAAWQELTTGFATPGYSTLDTPLTDALRHAGIQDASIVQIGCNNGREILSTFALGASNGLGIDQSEAFLQQAETLRGIAGYPCDFLESDIYALPADTPREFDIALITIGVLNWMPDLPEFFRAVASLLRPGGRLIIYETHPILEVFEPASPTPFTPAHSYFRTTPFVETQTITYDGSQNDNAPPSHWFIHTLGAILNAAIGAGLQIEVLDEFPHSIREVDYDQYEDQPAQLPLCYMLHAQKR